jgi:hypothetical protein
MLKAAPRSPSGSGTVLCDGNAKPSGWPDACKLLSPGELKALAPGTSSFKTQGQHGQFLGGGETPHYAVCKYSLRGAYDPPASQGYPPSWIQVELHGIADRRAVEQQWSTEEASQKKIAKKYPDQFALYNGPARCFWDGNELQCVAGTWSYWVLGQFIDNSGNDDTSLQKTFRTSVLVPAANALAGRMR